TKFLRESKEEKLAFLDDENIRWKNVMCFALLSNRVLGKKKRLTKKTEKAIRNNIDDLLPSNQVNPKKSCLTGSVNNSLILADSKINKVDHSTEPNKGDDVSEQFDARNLLAKVLSFLENSQGKKPDFKLLVNTNNEILFGEVKPPKYKNSSLLVSQDLVKLATFQSGTLDELVKKYRNRIEITSFRVWIYGVQIHIYQMDLDYDGLYRMYLIADIVIPTQKSQFISLMPILETFYNVKDSVSKVLKVITSNTSPLLFHSDYYRLSPPSPEPIKVTVVKGNSNRK
ncbi:10926_t:CDS:2, partial [Funneliformis caledonium]